MRTSLATCLWIIVCLPPSVQSQDLVDQSVTQRQGAKGPSSADGADDRAAPRKERQRDRSLPQISVIDKLLAVESALNSSLKRNSEAEWASDYQKLYGRFRKDGHPSSIRDEGKTQAYVALALGVKASDAVLALKARDLESLNVCAEQIDLLARNLGATDGELSMAGTVRHYANKKQWFSAFLALGRMQRDVTNYLESSLEKRKRDLAILVATGGWLQGGRVVTHVIDKHYTEWSSNVLREPRLVSLLQENLAGVDPAYLNDELVGKILKALPEIRRLVDVGLNDPVKREDVRKLHSIFDGFVEDIMTGPVKKVDEAPKAPVKPAAPQEAPKELPKSTPPVVPPPPPSAQATPLPKGAPETVPSVQVAAPSEEAPAAKAAEEPSNQKPVPPVVQTSSPPESPSASSGTTKVVALALLGLGAGFFAFRKFRG